MTSYSGFITLIVLLGVVVAASVFVLSRACEDIGCAFGSLDFRLDARNEACQMADRSGEFQRSGAHLVQGFAERAERHFPPAIPEFIRRDECPVSAITSL